MTGVVTRSVFFKQAEAQLDKVPEERLVALCFVDLDNLKKLNDTHGHAVGDTALKSIGYILREYEKKYDSCLSGTRVPILYAPRTTTIRHLSHMTQ